MTEAVQPKSWETLGLETIATSDVPRKPVRPNQLGGTRRWNLSQPCRLQSRRVLGNDLIRRGSVATLTGLYIWSYVDMVMFAVGSENTQLVFLSSNHGEEAGEGDLKWQISSSYGALLW